MVPFRFPVQVSRVTLERSLLALATWGRDSLPCDVAHEPVPPGAGVSGRGGVTAACVPGECAHPGGAAVDPGRSSARRGCPSGRVYRSEPLYASVPADGGGDTGSVCGELFGRL